MRSLIGIACYLILYFMLAFGVLCLAWWLFSPVCCIELNISGHSSGQGVQNLSFVGDLINVSIQQNSSWAGWNVTLGASA
jgi:hypothetical protein